MQTELLHGVYMYEGKEYTKPGGRVGVIRSEKHLSDFYSLVLGVVVFTVVHLQFFVKRPERISS